MFNLKNTLVYHQYIKLSCVIKIYLFTTKFRPKILSVLPFSLSLFFNLTTFNELTYFQLLNVCLGVSGVTGKHLRESLHINKSLCALADVLTALAESRPHIPYRNSRLTHLLQDSIGIL